MKLPLNQTPSRPDLIFHQDGNSGLKELSRFWIVDNVHWSGRDSNFEVIWDLWSHIYIGLPVRFVDFGIEGSNFEGFWYRGIQF